MTQMDADVEAASHATGRDPQTYAIIGAAMEVHGQLGPGFLEPVYQEALAIELSERQIPYRREVDLPVRYKGIELRCSYRADFVCHERIIVELKALRALTGIEESQLLNYLKATAIERGLLLNFGTARLEYRRLVRQWNHAPATGSGDRLDGHSQTSASSATSADSQRTRR